MEWPTVSAYTTSTVQKSTEYELEDLASNAYYQL